MGKKEKAVYAPGELSRVREKLGTMNDSEAKQLMQKLGGEIGYERSEDEEKAKNNPPRSIRSEKVEVRIGDRPGRPRRIVELPLEQESDSSSASGKKAAKNGKDIDPADNPSVVLKVSYLDRVKMDRFAGQPEFEIKSAPQILQSMFSFITNGPDYVNPVFATSRMAEYYKKLETLVVSTRTMFPRNNARRNERMKKSFPLVYLILDTIRYWNIERISGDLAKIQTNPKNAKVSDFTDIIRSFYKPLFILSKMDPDNHIRATYKILYKVLYLEDPMEAQSKYQELIRLALASFFEVRRDIHYLLYPLFMKMVSNKYISYERFFTARQNRIMAFLNVSEADQIVPVPINLQAQNPGEEQSSEEKDAGQGKDKEKQANDQNKAADGEKGKKEGEISGEEKAGMDAEDAEKKALSKGLQTLEILFPRAGWNKIETFPDLYPYFAGIFDFKRGMVYIAPTDPLQQTLILMRILEELFYGLRYVSFTAIPGPSGSMENIDTIMGDIVSNWHDFIEGGFEKEYLSRMSEYIRVLEGSSEERVSPYTKKLVTELHWIKRLYFLPYYKFETITPPPFQKKDSFQVYTKIRILKKYMTAVAVGIEQGNKAGGAGCNAHCDGINNPWDSYVFQVPNPLSTRLDAMLPPRSRNNASLIYFCLAIVTVLDHIVNDENSWAYSSLPGPLFRSEDGKGVMPLTGIDIKIDAEALFKQSLKQRKKKA